MYFNLKIDRNLLGVFLLGVTAFALSGEVQNSQKTGSKERILASAFTSSKKGTSYEAELMDRMSSFPEDDYQRADEVFEAWDKELNKIYKLLMSELSQNEKIELRNEERDWLKRKEKEIERRAGELCAGTDKMESYMVVEQDILWKREQ